MSEQSPWSVAQYERFKMERAQPFMDLLGLVQPAANMRVVDLGCGTGEWTQQLHDTVGAKSTLGVDSSETMLAKAASFAGHGLSFEKGTIEGFAPSEPLDLIFSNAAYHWVADHPALFARLTKLLAPGGQLAAQMPSNFDHPSHAVAEEISREAPFAEAVGDFRRAAVLPVDRYAQLLYELGYREQHVRLQVYGHVLAGPEEVIEWVKGTLLTDYQKRMPAPMFERFLARYREVLLSRLPSTRPYFFPFKRILLWARRAS